MGIDSGTLNRRVTIQKQSIIENSVTSGKVKWSDIQTVWAAVLPLRGKELFESDKTTYQADLKIIMRYGVQINTSNRLKINGRFFEIVTIINPNDGKNKFEIMAKELTSGERR